MKEITDLVKKTIEENESWLTSNYLHEKRLFCRYDFRDDSVFMVYLSGLYGQTAEEAKQDKPCNRLLTLVGYRKSKTLRHPIKGEFVIYDGRQGDIACTQSELFANLAARTLACKKTEMIAETFKLPFSSFLNFGNYHDH